MSAYIQFCNEQSHHGPSSTAIGFLGGEVFKDLDIAEFSPTRTCMYWSEQIETGMASADNGVNLAQ